MSTTHLIAINGDLISSIKDDPQQFATLLLMAVEKCGTTSPPWLSNALRHYGVQYLASSMNDIRGAIENAARAYL